MEINGNNYELLWNIWKITIGAGPTFTKELVREQDNDGNRYGNDNSQVTDAGLFFIDTK